ncbi:SRPBCC family protein [Dactylosporangium sp. AC04546]|uniref:SRPBCC family protein n=1 Tax=Dactylosporangium sp. AC04546 TaxID=2862460 RepID=UPI001EE14844|nr:SRPBCC family protein [Dactylosporangium sp. AC04546]WVK87835.1 SRPBCC family protein [Dactylosporangium sp. AC04546]
MMDIAGHLKAIHREVSRLPSASGETVAVRLRRSYDADVPDVWDAITDPSRIARWLMPISGDLRAGGSFQLEGNAGGDILECSPPSRLKVTFGGPTSIVTVRLSADGDRALLELEHTVPIEIAGGGAGALYVGPGWDGALMALARHLHGEFDGDPLAFAATAEGQEFARQSVHAWAAVARESGTATEAEVEAAVEASMGQFAPDAAS